MNDWIEVALGDVCEKPQYGAIASGVGDPVGPLFVRQTDLLDGRVDWSTVPYCASASVDCAKFALARDDLLVARLGSVGRAARIRDPRGAIFAGYLVRFRADRARADPIFLSYELMSPGWWAYVNAVRSGAVQPTLNAQQMAAFRFRLPPLQEQRAIAAVLESIDDKIDSNRRTIDKALNLASALYQRVLSNGSQEVTVEYLAEFHNRRRIPLSSQEREARQGDIPYYGATGIFGYVNEALFDEILVLVGEDGSVVRGDGGPVLQYIWGQAWINNHAHPLSGRSVSTELLYLALNRSDIRPLVTGAVQLKVSMGNLKRLALELPRTDDVKELEEQIGPIFAMWREKADEIRYLEKLRSALLPELLSGRIRVPYTARLEEAVA